MIKNLLVEIIEKLYKICRREKIEIVFTGGIAVGVYGIPRATYDVDGIALIGEEKIKGVLSALKKEGFKHDPKKPVKAIQGMPFVTLVYSKYKIYVDLFLARDKFQREIISRSRVFPFNRIRIKVVSPEDLILIKLQAGRERDIEDIRGIISESQSKLDFGYLKNWAKKLGVDLFLRDEFESLGI